MTNVWQRRALDVLRYGLCVAAIVYLVSVVPWHDHVRVGGEGGPQHRLIERRGDEFVVEQNGQPRTLTREEVHHVRVGTEQVPDIELGIKSVVTRVDVWLAVWSIIVFFPVLVLQTARLIVMLAVQGVTISFWTSTKLTFAGNFFNFALPGTTGGDLIKAYYLTRYTHLKTEAVTTVFLDRAIGLFGLVLLAGVSIFLTRDRSQFGQLIATLCLICAALAAGAIVIFSRRIRERLRLREIAQRLPLGHQLIRVGLATVAMRRHKGLVLLALAMTFVLQAIVMISAVIMARALGMVGDSLYYFIYVSIGFLIAAIPISPPQAIGIMEYAYVQFFTQGKLGNDPSQAFALALAVRLIQLVWAVPGLLVPLLGAHLPRRSELEELEAPSESIGPGPGAPPVATIANPGPEARGVRASTPPATRG